MALEFPGQKQSLQTAQSVQSAGAMGSLRPAGPGGARLQAQQQGAALGQAAAQASGQVLGQQNQVLAQQAMSADKQGQQALSAKSFEAEDAKAKQRLALSQQARQLSQSLVQQQAVDSSELFDDNFNFQKDEIGRTIFNERQLADYAMNHARDQEALENYRQEVTIMLEKRQTLYQRAFQVLEQAEKQNFASGEQQLDQDLMRRVSYAKKEAERKMQEAQNKAANSAAIWQGVTAVGGAVAMVYPPAGIALVAVGTVGSMVAAEDSKADIKAAGQAQKIQ
jgi:hypothetical protein